jgi:hypothetical protein
MMPVIKQKATTKIDSSFISDFAHSDGSSYLIHPIADLRVYEEGLKRDTARQRYRS